MDINKRYSILLIVVLLAIAPFFYFRKQTVEVRDEKIRLQEQVAEIIKTKDFSLCDEMKDKVYFTVCNNNIALNLAQERSDLSYCQKIDNTLVLIEECERQVIFKKSLLKENIEVCDETQNHKLK